MSSSDGKAYTVRDSHPEQERPFCHILVEGLMLAVHADQFEPKSNGEAADYEVLARPPYKSYFIDRNGTEHYMGLLRPEDVIPAVHDIKGFTLNGENHIGEVVEVIPASEGFFGLVRLLAPTEQKPSPVP